MHIVLNPASGKDEAVLAIINSVLREHGVRWDMSITQEDGDAYRLATEAIKKGYDCIAVYGGDGTVTEASYAFMERTVPMGVLPGGTSNIIAKDVGMPADTKSALEVLVTGNPQPVLYDTAEVNEQPFFYLMGIGALADVAKETTRELKNTFGMLAYYISGVKQLGAYEPIRFELQLDGTSVTEEGIGLLVFNSGNVGIANISIAPNISMADGLLDVVLIRQADIATIFEIAKSSLFQQENFNNLLHWQAKEIAIKTNTPRNTIIDDKHLSADTFTIRVRPKTLPIFTPQLPQ